MFINMSYKYTWQTFHKHFSTLNLSKMSFLPISSCEKFTYPIKTGSKTMASKKKKTKTTTKTKTKNKTKTMALYSQSSSCGVTISSSEIL